ncbi:MAG TPA: hypothetical protein DDW23_01280 [Planctomycetes bacterium]|nr:hypothetical protein [Planctomycetota bacterium]
MRGATFLNSPWSLLLTPLGWFWEVCALARHFLFRNGLRAQVKPPLPTLSIGNLAVGGTGKTPLLLDALRRLEAASVHAGVLSRGYGGDEGAIVRNRFPKVILEENPDRVRGLAAMLAKGKPDVLFLDDGFQHFQLARDKDLVLLDAECPWGRCLPSGPFREGRRALRRADFVVLSRAQSVGDADREAIWSGIRAIRRGLPSIPRVEGDIAVQKLHRLGKEDVRPSSWLDGNQVFLAAGVARPETFRRLCETAGACVIGEDWKADHHGWRSKDFDAWPRNFPILVTEKDAVKIRDIGSREVWEVKIDWAFSQGEEEWEMLLESLILPSRAGQIEPLWRAVDPNAVTPG